MQYLKEILRGIMIGIANIIPGVSGGTMAVSMGVYDKMIGAVNHIRTEFKKSVFTLLPYAIGMVLGIGALSFVIGFLFEEYPFQTGMAFIGLILGGIPALFVSIKGEKRSLAHYLILLLFFAGIVLLQFFGSKEENEVVLTPGLFMAGKLFLIGILASATMVIPGVSGSMIMMLLGVYTPIINTIREFIENIVHFNMDALLSGAAILAPFGIGIVLGVVVIAKIIGYLLEHAKMYTYMAIFGLVFASPVVVLMQTGLGESGIFGVTVGILCLALGFFVAKVLSK